MGPDSTDFSYPAAGYCEQPVGNCSYNDGRGPALDYYGALVWPYPDSSTPLYFMLTQRTQHWGAEAVQPGRQDPLVGMPGPAMIDVGLAVSRDGSTFKHVGGRESFLHGGAPGTFDSKMQWMMPSPVMRHDFGELWFYYGGNNRDHNGRVDGGIPRSGVGLAIGRLD